MKTITQNWVTDEQELKPPDFKNVLLTLVGFDEVVIGARWKNEWFLINDFKQIYKGDNGAVKVIAWSYLPEIYKH